MDLTLTLTPAQARELEGLIASGLRDLSHEIADTENPEYRRDLTLRRQNLIEVGATLITLLQAAGVGTGPGNSPLAREVAHPGG